MFILLSYFNTSQKLVTSPYFDAVDSSLSVYIIMMYCMKLYAFLMLVLVLTYHVFIIFLSVIVVVGFKNT